MEILSRTQDVGGANIGRVRSTALAACLLLSVAPAGAAEWVRVESPNFIVYGETGEGRVREVAAEFERFRDALGRVIPGADTPAAVPTVVVVFNSARSFELYVPRYKGKPIKLGGYFFSSDDMNIVAFADGKRDELLRTIFHEYVHLVIDNVSDGMPLWLNEGLAEYYSTFHVDDGGKGALIGQAIPGHLDLLTHQRHFPIPELLAIDADSPSYNEGERQSLFYAQSWALVHMLVSGTPNRSSLLGQYGRLVAGGTPSLDAWRHIFKDAPIGRELERYVGRETLSGFRYRFSQTIPTVKSYSSRVSEGDAQAVLGDLLRRVAPAQETSARFEKAIALKPLSARALALYGLLRLDEDKPDKALPLLMAAAKDKTDWLVQSHVATGLTRIVTTTDDLEPAVMATARGALAIAQAARPDLANGHALARAPRHRGRHGRDAGAAVHPARTSRLARPRRLHPHRSVRPDASRRLRGRAATPHTFDGGETFGRYPRERRRGPRTGDAARAPGGRISWRGWKARNSSPRAPAVRVGKPRSTEHSSPANLASRDSSNGSTARRRKS